MYINSTIRINYFKMSNKYQLVTSPEDLNSLQEVLEENKIQKIVTGDRISLKEAKEESENFMKSNFNLHEVFYEDKDKVNEILSSSG